MPNTLKFSSLIANGLIGVANGIAPLNSLAKVPLINLPQYTKSDVGLSNVDNTSDLNKPISNATSTALNTKVNISQIGVPNGIVPLDANLKINSNYLDIDLNFVNLTKADVGLSNVDNTSDLNKPISNAVFSALASKVDKLSIGAANGVVPLNSNTKIDANYLDINISSDVTSVNSKTGDVNLTKSDIGLSNVDNTSDLNKPISSATSTALNAKVDKITGKSLSTEDFTTEHKVKLENLEFEIIENQLFPINAETITVNSNFNTTSFKLVDPLNIDTILLSDFESLKYVLSFKSSTDIEYLELVILNFNNTITTSISNRTHNNSDVMIFNITTVNNNLVISLTSTLVGSLSVTRFKF